MWKLDAQDFSNQTWFFQEKNNKTRCFQSYMTYIALHSSNHLNPRSLKLCFPTSIGWTFRIAPHPLIFSNSCQLQCFCQILGQRWPREGEELLQVWWHWNIFVNIYNVLYYIYHIYVYLSNVHIYNYICNMYVYVDYAYSHIYICLRYIYTFKITTWMTVNFKHDQHDWKYQFDFIHFHITWLLFSGTLHHVNPTSFGAPGLDHGTQDFVTAKRTLVRSQRLRWSHPSYPFFHFRMVSKPWRSIPVIQHQLDTH